jgi:hypothetical protein
MTQRPIVLLYPAAIGLAAVIYAAIRVRTQLAALRADLKDQRRRILDLEEYLRPLRDYSKNHPNPM